MESLLTPPPETPVRKNDREALRHLGHRILRVIPPGTRYMETFLRLSRMDWSDAIKTAGITCGGNPRLLFNRDFVAKYCPMDEDLFLLVLHELHHVLYGHHLLFPGAGLAHNIAFDAIINARLCRCWGSARHARFFRRVYPDPGFPEVLLCPPPAWPGTPGKEESQAEMERLGAQLGTRKARKVLGVRDDLYKGVKEVTYKDVLALLRDDMPKASPLLLGNHDNGIAPTDQSTVASDPFLQGTAKAMHANLEECEKRNNQAGRGLGIDAIKPEPRDTRLAFLYALRGVLIRAGVYAARASGYHQRTMADTVRESMSVLPNYRDRTRMAREILFGMPPLLCSFDAPARTMAWEPAGVAHVYLDVSGSMADDLPWVVGALRPLEQAGLCRIFLFSTIVAPLPRGRLGKDPLTTTFGTSIDCVLHHVIGLDTKHRPRRIVLLTDGFFHKVYPPTWEKFKATGTAIHGAVTATGSVSPLKEMAASLTQLPPYV